MTSPKNGLPGMHYTVLRDLKQISVELLQIEGSECKDRAQSDTHRAYDLGLGIPIINLDLGNSEVPRAGLLFFLRSGFSVNRSHGYLNIGKQE